MTEETDGHDADDALPCRALNGCRFTCIEREAVKTKPMT